MTRPVKKDPHPISANKLMQDMEDVYNFVEEVAELNLDAISPHGEVAQIIRKSRRIRKKFKVDN